MSGLFNSPLSTPGMLKTLSAKPPELLPAATSKAPDPIVAQQAEWRNNQISMLQKAGPADTLLSPSKTPQPYG